MKKSLKIIALTLTVIMVSVSLCSCRALDEAKANRGIYSGDHLELEFKGETYRFLAPGKFTFIRESLDGWTNYRATEPEVPVLLAGWYGDMISVNNEENLIITSVSISEFAGEIANEALYNRVDPEVVSGIHGGNNASYVREDLYDATKAAADADHLECYFLEYSDFDEADYFDDSTIPDWREYNDSYVNSHHTVILDEKETDVVDDALKAPDKDKVSYEELGDNQRNIVISCCDRNKLLRDWDVSYYLVKDEEKYYFRDGTTNNEKCMVPLNEKDSKIIAQLFDQYPGAVNGFQVEWEFDNRYGYDTGYGNSSNLV